VGNLLKKKNGQQNGQQKGQQKEWIMNCPYCHTSSMACPITPGKLQVTFKPMTRSGKKTDTEQSIIINEYTGPHGPFTAWAICDKCKGFWVHRLSDVGGGTKLMGVWGSPEKHHRVCPNCKTVYDAGQIEKLDIVSIECTCGGWKPRKRDFCERQG
jgi:hypothetical protein